jgi:hypothetical protein
MVIDKLRDALHRADFDLGRKAGAQQIGCHVGAHRQNEGGLGQQRAFAVGDDRHPDAVLALFDRNPDRGLLLDQTERAAQFGISGPKVFCRSSWS